MADRIQATTFDEAALQKIIEAMYGPTPADDVDTTGGRFAKLHDKIRLRELHYHNDPKVDPPLPEPYANGSRYQTDFLRRTNVRLLARQTENQPIIKVMPGSSKATEASQAENFARVMNRILDLVQERERLDITRTLHHNANALAYGVLHWCKAPDVWPKMGDYKHTDTPGGDFNDYEEVDDEEKSVPKSKRYREKDDAYRKRQNHAKAEAGAPWFIECPHPGQFAFIEDRSQENGMALATLRRRIPFLDYAKKVKNQDKITLSLNDSDSKIAIFEEKDAPPSNSPSGGDYRSWGRVVYVVEVWTRDEYYEMASGSEHGVGWTLIKSHKHPYKMPPFALAVGHENPSPDPAYKFEPLMTGIYRIKPFYDKARSLADIIAEMIALPLWYIELGDGQQFTQGGKPVFLSRNSLTAQVMPKGSKLVKVDFQMNPAINEWINSLKEEMEDAAPSTGATAISAATQAWAIRLQQAEANIEVQPSVRSVVSAIRTMSRNMAFVMSLNADEGGFGEPIWVYAKTKDGMIDKSTAIGVDPADIPTLELEVTIDSHSSAERITMEQHGLDMMANEFSLITRREWAEDYAGKPDAERAIMEKDAETIWLTKIKPVVMEQELAREYEDFIVLGANGMFVGPGGVEVSPEQVLGMNAGRGAPTPVTSPNPTAPETSPIPAEMQQANGMPTGGGLSVPGTVPMGPQS